MWNRQNILPYCTVNQMKYIRIPEKRFRKHFRTSSEIAKYHRAYISGLSLGMSIKAALQKKIRAKRGGAAAVQILRLQYPAAAYRRYIIPRYLLDDRRSNVQVYLELPAKRVPVGDRCPYICCIWDGIGSLREDSTEKEHRL